MSWLLELATGIAQLGQRAHGVTEPQEQRGVLVCREVVKAVLLAELDAVCVQGVQLRCWLAVVGDAYNKGVVVEHCPAVETVVLAVRPDVADGDHCQATGEFLRVLHSRHHWAPSLSDRSETRRIVFLSSAKVESASAATPLQVAQRSHMISFLSGLGS